MPSPIHPSKPLPCQQAIAEFLRSYDLPNTKRILKSAIRSAICSDDFDDKLDRAELIDFGENLNILIESLYNRYGKR